MQQPVSVVSDIEESGNSLLSKMRFPLGTGERSMQDRLFQIQQKIITDIVDRESCIIVGRCSDYILRNYKNCINVYIYAPFEARYHNCVNSLNMNPKEAKRMIQEVDRARLQYHKRYAKYEPQDINYKDILINSSLLGVDGTAEYLVDMVKKKFDWLF
jgi:cytidylate kinase